MFAGIYNGQDFMKFENKKKSVVLIDKSSWMYMPNSNDYFENGGFTIRYL